MKFKPLLVIPLLMSASLLGACSNESNASNTDQPAAKVVTKVSTLSDKEYGEVGTDELKDPKKEDFRKVNIKVTLSEVDKIEKEKVDMPNYKKIFNNIDKDEQTRYWFGKGDAKEDDEGNQEVFTQEFVLYTKNLSEDDIKTALETNEIKTSWVNKDNKEKTQQEITAADNISFK
ncbi:hypothetical protein O0Q50_23365 [Priestia aryabhattai]|uniref:Lipoprotein n=1 Tax=Priestia aryabhattai TaxID=412384 RepID=A0AAX6NEB8_PRIAR|nr:hypothetical protein [Priestia aryabhattai]MDU9694127.1 hypothetical protein [Priestia aryabhattai]